MKLFGKSKYYLLYFFCSLIISKCGFCNQTEKIDSLKQIISTQENDTNKVKTLLSLAWECIDSNTETALEYCHSAFKLSSTLNYIPGIIDSYYYYSYIYKGIGNLDSAIFFIRKHINFNDSIGNKIKTADGYLIYGQNIRRKGKTKIARNYYFKSLKIYKQYHDTVGIICCYNGLGITYKLTTDFDSAAFYYIKCLELCEEIEFESGIGSLLINLGKVYLELNNYESATIYTKRSIEYSIKHNNTTNHALAYTNLGMIASKKGDDKSSLEYYNKSKVLYEKTGNIIGINNLYLNIGNTYKKQGKYSKALLNYNTALKAFRKIEYKTGLITGLKGSAEVYAKLGRLNKALSLFDSCLVLTKETEEKEKRKEALMSIYQAYSEAGNYQKAFEYLIKFHDLEDSIYTINKEEIIANLTLKYEKEKDLARILTLENENLEKDLNLKKRTNQRNIYLFSGSGAIALILFLFIFYQYKARKDKIIAKQKIRQLEEEKKLLAAKSIVEGQDVERKRIARELQDGLGVLLSTTKMQFSTIKDKSPGNKPLIEKATHLLEQAAGDVREISHNMMPGLLTKFGLYEAVEDMIEQLGETDGVNATCEITGDTKRLPENTEIMLYRVIQEMVNNTLKHAEANNISLKMNILSDKLKIQFSDDGKGFNVEDKLASKSIGLGSIQSRVNFLGGHITIESAYRTGTSYIIEILTR